MATFRLGISLKSDTRVVFSSTSTTNKHMELYTHMYAKTLTGGSTNHVSLKTTRTVFAASVVGGLRGTRMSKVVSLPPLRGTIVNLGSRSGEHALTSRNDLGTLRLTTIHVLSYTKCRDTVYELFWVWATMIFNDVSHGGVLTAQSGEVSTSCLSKRRVV